MSRFRLIEVSDACLDGGGFHAFEAETGLCWTDGDAILPASVFTGFDAAVELVVLVGCSTRYPALGALSVLAGQRRTCRQGRFTANWRSVNPWEGMMIYELRIYECVPGRLPDLNKRFSTITLGIWEKHGIKQAGFWTTLIGESNQTLYYMLAWESLAERETKWNAFQADPEWHAARARTEENGPIVAKVTNTILGPTPYSSVK